MHEGRKTVESERSRIPVRGTAVLIVSLLVSSAFIAPDIFIGESMADSLPSHERVFRLHEGENVTTSSDYDWLNSTGPSELSTMDYDGDGLWGITIRKNLPSQRWRHFWVLYPEVNSEVTIQGDLSAHIWAASRDNESSSLITVDFADMDPVNWYDPDEWVSIASVTVPMVGPIYSSFKAYDLVASGVDYLLPAGHHLVITISRGDPVNDGLLVLYDNYLFDSYVSFDTPDFINIDEVEVVDVHGIPRAAFSDSEPVTVTANVSNPYGVYEIVGASILVSYVSNGTLVLDETAMVWCMDDPSPLPSWSSFEYDIPSLPNGTLRVLVLASDPQGTPTWLSTTVLVVGVDHFEVTVPEGVTVLEPFDMTVSAVTSSGAVIPEWTGEVFLEAYLPDMSALAYGTLGTDNATISGSDMGTVALSGQVYDHAEDTIVIRAYSGTHEGWSSLVVVYSGPVVGVEIEYSGSDELSAGATVTLTASGVDAYGNANTTWTPNWTLSSAIGVLTPDGLEAVLETSSVGTAYVNCTNDLNGANDSVMFTVSPSLLNHIEMSPSGTLTIREGVSQALSATGYDLYGNEVDIGGAVWVTNTSGTLVGIGGSATYVAGFIPETGVIEVSVGGVSASLDVVVLNAEDGPWLSDIPVQAATEDSNWTLVLTSYWHHVNGTSGLRWYAEGVDTSLYTVLHDQASEAYVRFLTQPDKFGNDVFRLWVRDSNGFSTYQDISVNIQSVNDAPEFVHTPPTELYVKFDTAYSFDYSYYISDVDTPKTELRMSSSMTSSVYFDRLIGTFIFPEEAEDYFEVVTLTVTDASEGSRLDSTNSDSLKVVVWVTDDTPPSLNQSLPDITMYEGEVKDVFDLDDYFFDLDNDYLVYKYGFENLEVEIGQETHVVTISATLEWSGVTEGVFTAVDPVGALKSDTVIVTVIAVNDPPEFRNPGTVHVRYDTTYRLDAEMYVSDPDNSLSELSFSSNSTYITYDAGAKDLLFSFPGSVGGGPFSEPYMVPVSITVTDPLGNSTVCNFEVLVSDNAPPVVSDPVPYYDFVSFLEDGYLNGTIVLDILFYDPDDSDLYYSAVGNEKVYVSIYEDSVVNFTAATNWSGSEDIEFVAVDPHGGWCVWHLTVAVIPVNDPPHILPIPDFVVRGGPRNMHFDISQYIIDSESAYSDITITASPDPEVFVVGNYLYVEIPEGTSEITVTLSAEDSSGAESNEVTFKVVLEKTWAEIIGYPYSLPIVLMAAGIGGYFIARRLPRPYEVEDLFLIHNDGRLISHVTKDEDSVMDKDVVSAMFTAVQEFVRDSFQAGEVGLKKLEIGDRNVVIEKGDSVYLAMIYSGWPPKTVFDTLAMLLRDVEERYRGKLERWNGTKKVIKGVDEMLQEYTARRYLPGSWETEEEIDETDWVDILSKES